MYKNEDIVLANLRYHPVAKPLRTRAFAEIASKALHLSEKASLTLPEITRDIASFLGIPRISRGKTKEALQYLKEQGHVSIERSGHWSLTPAGESNVSKCLEQNNERRYNAFMRHFGDHSADSPEYRWFTSALVEFFSNYGDAWVAATCARTRLRTSIPRNLSTILQPVINQHHLREKSSELIESFYSFITSIEPEDAQYSWVVGQAMYAARFAAAAVSSDPISTKRLRDSTFILDTNILIAAALEGHRLADSLNALSKILRSLGISMKYISETRDEYRNTVEAKRTVIARLFRSYSREVLAGSSDPFILTALNRECESVEDIKVFFDSISDISQEFDEGLLIIEESAVEVVKATEKSRADEKLQRKLADIWLRRRHRRKRPNALRHDAALLAATDALRRSDTNAWCITSDQTLHEYSISTTRSTSKFPLALSFDVLLNILAVEDAGGHTSSDQFAPLLASILSLHLEPASNTYQSTDLAWLLDIQEKAALLPSEEVARFAKRIAKARMEGKSKDDPELRLEMERTFQDLRLDYDQEIKTRTLEETAQRNRADKAERKCNVLEARIERMERQESTQRAKSRRNARILVLGLVTLSLIALYWFHFSPRTTAAAGKVLLSVAPIALTFLLPIFTWVLPSYRKDCRDK